MTGIISPVETDDEAMVTADMSQHLAAVRELVLRAHPGIVPELLRGDSLEALLASVQPATDAYARIAESLKPGAEVAATVSRVPAGGSPAVVVDAERLPAAEKIRRGLEVRRRG
jgi:hypothetical protein